MRTASSFLFARGRATLTTDASRSVAIHFAPVGPRLSNPAGQSTSSSYFRWVTVIVRTPAIPLYTYPSNMSPQKNDRVRN